MKYNSVFLIINNCDNVVKFEDVTIGYNGNETAVIHCARTQDNLLRLLENSIKFSTDINENYSFECKWDAITSVM